MRPLTKEELMSELTVYWTKAEKYNEGMSAVETKNFMRELKLFLKQDHSNDDL